MAETHTTPEFTGPHESALAELAKVIDWLWAEHDKSFVKAGDDQVYAFGGDGYVLVFDERRWSGLIELITPQGSLQFKLDDNGKVSVVSSETDPAAVTRIIKEGADGLKRYYENRYWSTPKTAAV